MSSTYNTPRIGPLQWLVLIVAGAACGCLVHYLAISESYRSALRILEAAPAAIATSWSERLPDPFSTNLIRALGITDDSQFTLMHMLSRGLSDGQKQGSSTEIPPLSTIPILAVVPKFLNPASCQCNANCEVAFKAAFARQLLGWPGTTNNDALLLQTTFRAVGQDGKGINPATQVDKNKACQALVRSADIPISVKASFCDSCRSAPKSPLALAEILLGESECVGVEADHQKCRLLVSLFQAALDNPTVRNARALRVNFFYGWERAVVWSLAFVVLFALLSLWLQRRLLLEEALWLDRELFETNQILDERITSKPRHDKKPKSFTNDIRQRFSNEFPRGPQVIHKIVEAMDECVDKGDRQHLGAIVSLHLGEIERQREVLNAVITFFPAIGLIATLRGLIHALAGASGIVTGAGDAKAAAVDSVTALLSAAFATTLIALVCMTVFALLNLSGGNRERALIDDTYKRLLAVFWPDRVPSTPQHSISVPAQAS